MDPATGFSTSSTQARGIATDNQGNVYVLGQTRGVLDGEEEATPGKWFLAKYDNTGSELWLKQYRRSDHPGGIN